MSVERAQTPANRTIVTVSLIERFFRWATAATKWGALVLIARYAALAIQGLSGHTTEASFTVVVELVKRTAADELVWVLLAALGIAYGVYQKRLRRRTIAEYSGIFPELERGVDPNRSSSGLLPDGTTNPNDI